jgi:hypothetical protein
VAEDDRAFATRLARYCARNPVALERLTYDRVAKAVTLRISPKSITHFGPKRSPVSVHGDQPFRLMSITGRRTRTRG